MAWPAYGTLIRYAEKPGISPILRSQFERGPAKQAKLFSKQPYDLTMTWVFTNAEYATWLTWYDDTIDRGATPFDITNPFTGGTISAVIKGGEFQSQPFNMASTHVQVSLTLEYYR